MAASPFVPNYVGGEVIRTRGEMKIRNPTNLFLPAVCSSRMRANSSRLLIGNNFADAAKIAAGHDDEVSRLRRVLMNCEPATQRFENASKSMSQRYCGPVAQQKRATRNFRR